MDKAETKALRHVYTAFARLWRAKVLRDGCSVREAVEAGQRWLARELGEEQVYVTQLTEEQCRRVLELCERRRNDAI